VFAIEVPNLRDDRIVRRMHRLAADVEAEIDQPPSAVAIDFAAYSTACRNPPHGSTIDRLIARDERGRLVGAAALTVRDDAALRGVGKFHIEVRARRRRQGIGTALLMGVRAAAASYELSLLYSWAPAGGAGLGFLAHSLGCQRGEEIWSVLDLSRTAERRVDEVDVELRHWVGPCPSELLERFADLHRAVGASARGSEAGSEQVTPELIRELESSMSMDWLTVAAVDPKTGNLVGFSQIELPDPPSRVAHQQFTGVDPAWRRRGIARRLKTRSRALLREEYPGVGYVITENAAGNEPIRALNAAMGFRVYRHFVSWQESISPA
jgi:GNAT superfamily N-acetyltransferase